MTHSGKVSRGANCSIALRRWRHDNPVVLWMDDCAALTEVSCAKDYTRPPWIQYLPLSFTGVISQQRHNRLTVTTNLHVRTCRIQNTTGAVQYITSILTISSTARIHGSISGLAGSSKIQLTFNIRNAHVLAFHSWSATPAASRPVGVGKNQPGILWIWRIIHVFMHKRICIHALQMPSQTHRATLSLHNKHLEGNTPIHIFYRSLQHVF